METAQNRLDYSPALFDLAIDLDCEICLRRPAKHYVRATVGFPILGSQSLFICERCCGFMLTQVETGDCDD
jgi:hypothetical protein